MSEFFSSKFWQNSMIPFKWILLFGRNSVPRNLMFQGISSGGILWQVRTEFRDKYWRNSVQRNSAGHHSKEFVNNLWRRSSNAYHHSTTLLKNLSSNPLERLRTRGPGVRPNWGVWLNAKCSCSTQQCTAVQECSSTGVTPNYAMFGCKTGYFLHPL